MDAMFAVTQEAFQRFWRNAVGPLHSLNWETAALFAAIVLCVALVATLLLRWSWRYSKPTFEAKRIKGHHHTFADNLRVSVPEYMRFCGRDPKLGIKSEAARQDIARDASKYYVITIVETAKRRPVLYRELRLQPGQAKGALQDDTVQLDQALLTDVRLNNGYDDDDDAGVNVSGTYNIYVRHVRWYDVRHWLLHPNREIRIVVWVTLVTTTLPVLLDLLFG